MPHFRPFLLLLLIGLAPAVESATGPPDEQVAPAGGLAAIDGQRALRDQAWGLTAISQADPILAAAITAGQSGDRAPLAAWTRSAALPQLELVAQILMNQSSRPIGEAAIAALHPVYEGLLDGLPAAAGDLRVTVANHLAYSLVARQEPPSAAELARAGVLGDDLELALQRPEVARSRNGHGIADTVGCIRFLQGDRVKAAAMWRLAIDLGGRSGSTLYRRRLAAAEGQAATSTLPR